MSKKSRKRNKKILGALAAGLGAMALMKRKKFTKELKDKEIPKIVALGREITDQSSSKDNSANILIKT